MVQWSADVILRTFDRLTMVSQCACEVTLRTFDRLRIVSQCDTDVTLREFDNDTIVSQWVTDVLLRSTRLVYVLYDSAETSKVLMSFSRSLTVNA